jgi:Protein of unknown function (DUF1214)
LKVIQKSQGKFEVPNWDREALSEIRGALKILGKYLPIRDTAYGGSIKEVDPIAHLVGTADTWGGWKPENAVYQSYVPQKNDGKTAYVLTLKDVPSAENAFWSISVYNEDGYFQENEQNKYVINSRMGKADKDGSVVIHFGGDSSKDNFLPIMPGWNYMLRIYLDDKESIMNVKNIWKAVKNRYRLSTKVQMNFELSFPKYLIAKCWFTADNTYQVRTQKVSPSLKGIVFSDTIPLSWFTSSVLIPWEKVLKLAISNTAPSIEGILNMPLSSNLNKKSLDFEYCTIRLNDPREMTIDLPWSKEFTEYVQENNLFDI